MRSGTPPGHGCGPETVDVVHTLGSLSAETGGPARSVPALCEALLGASVAVRLVAARAGKNELARLPSALRSRTLVPAAAPRWGLGRRFRRCLVDALEPAAGPILHDHGIWLPTNHMAVGLATRLGLPLIVSPRGMLEPAARRHRAWKKRFAWLLYQRRDLGAATLLHATGSQEARKLSELALGCPVAVIPNGVTPPAAAARTPREGPLIALFLGRIHPIKGLLDLVRAWASVSPRGWRMVIAGPDHRGHRQEVEAAVAAAGLAGTLRFSGPVSEQDKWATYDRADLFILPSSSENFGLVAAEALAARVPVITTRGTPWREVEEHGCGWWVEPGADSLAAALAAATALDREQLAAMGERGRRLVEERYAWPALGRRMRSVYEWVLGLREHAPDCVWHERATG